MLNCAGIHEKRSPRRSPLLLAVIIGFLFGFIGSMPVAGPLAVVIFARALEGRPRSALHIAVGGAVAEAIYAFIAFWGLSLALGADAQSQWSGLLPTTQAIACVILLLLGITFLNKEITPSDPANERPGKTGVLLGFTLVALNPTLIATWTGAATTLLSTGWVRFEAELAGPFAASAALGIVAWFVLLVHLTTRYSGRFTDRSLTRLLRTMGYLLIGLSGWFGWSSASYFLA